MAELTIYNTSKSRLETIKFEFTDENTTWFDDHVNDRDVHMITDAIGGLLITQNGYYYPVWIGGQSRADIAHDNHSALDLMRYHIEGE
jgi:hypothetical protein